MPYQDNRKPDPSIISEQAKATLRFALVAGLSPILAKYVAPDVIDALSDSTATVLVSAGGVGVSFLWSLLNKSRLVKLTK